MKIFFIHIFTFCFCDVNMHRIATGAICVHLFYALGVRCVKLIYKTSVMELAAICAMKRLSMDKFVHMDALCPCIIKRFNVACRTLVNARLLICTTGFTLVYQHRISRDCVLSDGEEIPWRGCGTDGVLWMDHTSASIAMDEILWSISCEDIPLFFCT